MSTALFRPLIAFLLLAACDSVDDTLSLAPQLALLGPGEVETVHTFDAAAGESPEGIAVHRDGYLYVSMRRLEGTTKTASLLKVDPGTGQAETVAVLDPDIPAALPGALGVAIDQTGAAHVALMSGDPSTHGVWRLPVGQEPERLAGSERIVFPNALTFDPRGDLYVTDTATGAVWRFTNGEDPGELWLQHPSLASPDPGSNLLPGPIGANGIAFAPPRKLYVANTEGGRLVEVPIQQDGSPGTPRIVAADPALLTIDGIAVGGDGSVYAAIAGYPLLPLTPVVRIDPASGAIEPATAQPTGFDFPTSLAFGRGKKTDPQSLYVVNAALRELEGPRPGPGIVRLPVGGTGFPIP